MLGGLTHIILHFARATFIFLKSLLFYRKDGHANKAASRVATAKQNAMFGLTYESVDPVRKLWKEQYFLARFSVSLMCSNWAWWPISQAEKAHRKFDPFLWISERHFADPAFIDRIAKGLFLFFILYALNWVSINGENISNMFEPP